METMLIKSAFSPLGSEGYYLPYQGQLPAYEKPSTQSGYSGFPDTYSSGMNTGGDRTL